MIVQQIKNIVNSLISRQKYPDATIAIGSWIDNETTLGKDVVICSNSSVFKSIIENQVTIGTNSYIHSSKLSENIVVYSNCQLSKTAMGGFSYVADNSRLNLVKLGKFCSIGPDVLCGRGEHPTNFLSTNPVFFSTLNQCGTSFSDKDYFEEVKEIIIGNDVWIGARSFIRDGVRIGDGAIIAAGAVVVKDVPAYAVVGGVPAKLIRWRFPESIINQLLQIKWWNWPEAKLREFQPSFVTSNIDNFINLVSDKSENDG